MTADEEIVSRAVEGDEQAFATLFERHRERVFRLAVSILGPGATGEAEEVTQEVFLRAHQALRSFRGDSKFSSWLYRVTFNQTINLKSRVRFKATHITDETLAHEPTTDPDALARLQAARRNATIEDIVNELPEAYQAALRLHYWMGESVLEIADLLGVPPNTVKSYLFRARKLMKARLQGRGYGG